MKQPRFWALFAGCLFGSLVLAAWFAAYWPASRWPIVPREQLAEQGRQVAAHFGLNVNGWRLYQVASVAKPLVQDGREKTLGGSPLSVRLTFVHRDGPQVAEVGFDSAGRFNYWRPPHNYKPNQKFQSDIEAAGSAFQYAAGADAGNYKSPSRSMGYEEHQRDYTWKKNETPGADLRENIKVSVVDGVIRTIERKTYLASEDDNSDDDYGHTYWEILAGIFGLLCTATVITILSLYVLWLARRAINHKFPIRLAAAGLVFMSFGLVAGTAWEKAGSLNLKRDLPIGNTIVQAGLILCFVAVGRGISERARPKWMPLEQLCRLAPLAKRTGASLGAGLALSPLLVAVPFLIAGCGLFPHSLVLPQNAELLYARSPVFDCVKSENALYLMGFWGFGVPALQRLIRSRWLQWFILLPLGTLFFADATRVISGPLAAPLAAGCLTLGVFWFTWNYFDMLAVITLQAASGLLLGLLMLAQKGQGGWSIGAAMAGLLMAALWCQMRGREASEGDPLASAPTLLGFRAEREKLRAEFSVARRAQQDMLPQTPPEISGYTIAASCTPSLEVGGDLYDFLKLPDGRIGIGVADVSGKGVPAALYMTLTKGLLAAVTKNTSQLAEVVDEVNRHLYSVTRKKVFVTMVLAFLDPEKGWLQSVRAGHNPLVWRQRSLDLTTLVTPAGMGLGITAGRIFNTQLQVDEMLLTHGDAVVFYSDGITEAMNEQLEQFGEQRLMDAVKKADHLDATAAHDSILAEVKEFLGGVHPQDDMTLVVLRVGEHR